MSTNGVTAGPVNFRLSGRLGDRCDMIASDRSSRRRTRKHTLVQYGITHCRSRAQTPATPHNGLRKWTRLFFFSFIKSISTQDWSSLSRWSETVIKELQVE